MYGVWEFSSCLVMVGVRLSAQVWVAETAGFV